MRKASPRLSLSLEYNSLISRKVATRYLCLGPNRLTVNRIVIYEGWCQCLSSDDSFFSPPLFTTTIIPPRCGDRCLEFGRNTLLGILCSVLFANNFFFVFVGVGVARESEYCAMPCCELLVLCLFFSNHRQTLPPPLLLLLCKSKSRRRHPSFTTRYRHQSLEGGGGKIERKKQEGIKTRKHHYHQQPTTKAKQ